MTKETILNKISEQNNRDSWSLDNGMDYFDGNASSVFSAMDLYAKQECIKYAKFCMENTCQDLNIPTVWIHNPTYKSYTDEELYNLYLKSKQ